MKIASKNLRKVISMYLLAEASPDTSGASDPSQTDYTSDTGIEGDPTGENITDTQARISRGEPYTNADGFLVLDHVSDDYIWEKANSILSNILSVARVDDASDYYSILDSAGISTDTSKSLLSILGRSEMLPDRTWTWEEWLRESEPESWSSWETCRDDYFKAWDLWNSLSRDAQRDWSKDVCNGCTFQPSFITKREGDIVSAEADAWSCWSDGREFTFPPGSVGVRSTSRPERYNDNSVTINIPRNVAFHATPLSRDAYTSWTRGRSVIPGSLTDVQPEIRKLGKSYTGIAAAFGTKSLGFRSWDKSHIGLEDDFFREYRLESWDELAGIIGHEIAHLFLDHKGYNRDSLTHHLDKLKKSNGKIEWENSDGTVSLIDPDDISFEGAWQANEEDADRLGEWFATQAGYDSFNIGKFLTRLESDMPAARTDSSSSSPSTHLPAEYRVHNAALRNISRDEEQSRDTNENLTIHHIREIILEEIGTYWGQVGNDNRSSKGSMTIAKYPGPWAKGVSESDDTEEIEDEREDDEN